MDDRTLKKVVLDAGHGGEDPGTIANGITEKDYTLKITNYIHNRLDELGIPNKLSRDSDITLDANNRPQKIQSLYGNGNDVIVVSNHINAGGGDGAEIIYALRNNDSLAKKIAKEFENVGQNVRKYYQRRLPSNPAKDYYYIMRDTPNNETIIVEYGFADSTGDDVNQLKNNWENLAEAVVKAITEYAGGKYIAPTGAKYYIVKTGDSLWSISKRFGITVDELKKANNLKSNLLSVGQNLIIPGLTSDATDEYIVKKGDTLYGIARKFGLTVTELKKLNNLISNSLSIGDVLKVSKLTSNIDGDNTYIVKKGDSLYSIAQKYKTDVDTLKKLNNLTSNNLSINQILKIPKQSQTNQVYTVEKGDNLYGIARKFNTTVAAIKKLNNLDSDNLSIGQKLLIP